MAGQRLNLGLPDSEAQDLYFYAIIPLNNLETLEELLVGWKCILYNDKISHTSRNPFFSSCPFSCNYQITWKSITIDSLQND